MARTKKIKIKNEKAVQTVDAETKGAQAFADSGDVIDDGRPIVEQVETESPQSETQETDNVTHSDEIADIMSGFSSAPEVHSIDPKSNETIEKRTRKPRKSKEPEPQKPILKVPGRLFLTVHSRVFTGAVGLIESFRKNPMPDAYIQALGLSEDDLNNQDLILAAEEAIKAMKIEQNPIAVFYGSLGAIFLNNYMMLVAFMKQQRNEHEQQPGSNPKTKI